MIDRRDQHRDGENESGDAGQSQPPSQPVGPEQPQQNPERGDREAEVFLDEEQHQRQQRGLLWPPGDEAFECPRQKEHAECDLVKIETDERLETPRQRITRWDHLCHGPVEHAPGRSSDAVHRPGDEEGLGNEEGVGTWEEPYTGASTAMTGESDRPRYSRTGPGAIGARRCA